MNSIISSQRKVKTAAEKKSFYSFNKFPDTKVSLQAAFGAAGKIFSLEQP